MCLNISNLCIFLRFPREPGRVPFRPSPSNNNVSGKKALVQLKLQHMKALLTNSPSFVCMQISEGIPATISLAKANTWTAYASINNI
jgi:hypothetical protein